MKSPVRLLLLICLATGAIAADGLSDRKQRQIAAQFRKALHLEDTCAQIKSGRVDPMHLAVIRAGLSSTDELFIHQQRGASGNTVFVNDVDGREAVFGPDREPVADDINTATFNYFPRKDGVRHFFFDTNPWIAWGYSRKDPTTPDERIGSYVLDLLGGLNAASQQAELSPVNVATLKPGEIETYAIFVLALRAGQAEELYALVSNHRMAGLPSITPLLQKIEAGLRKVYADAPRR